MQMFADGTKVHPIHHKGKYFVERGPINAPRSPQGRVPICQAGGSPRGQLFASRWADTIITEGGGGVEMKDIATCPPSGCGVKPQSRRHQGAVFSTAYYRRFNGGGARACTNERGRNGSAYRPTFIGHVAPYRHRFFQVRSRCAVTRAHHQRPSIISPNGSARPRAQS